MHTYIGTYIHRETDRQAGRQRGHFLPLSRSMTKPSERFVRFGLNINAIKTILEPKHLCQVSQVPCCRGTQVSHVLQRTCRTKSSDIVGKIKYYIARSLFYESTFCLKLKENLINSNLNHNYEFVSFSSKICIFRTYAIVTLNFYQ
jgi:hypothetical protein